MMHTRTHLKKRPLEPTGLYDPAHEHDACGIGAIVNISGEREHAIIEQGNQILMNLQHRGAAGADGVTGDGAGMLLQIPHRFFVEEATREGVRLPESGRYGVAQLFLPTDDKLREQCERIVGEELTEGDLRPLGWRDVPTDNACLGEIAKAAEPVVCQLFIDGNGRTDEVLERRLYVVRKKTEHRIRRELPHLGDEFYFCTMSGKTICYKGMFLAPQLMAYYPDLGDSRVESALALVHQRYSTNTFPSWPLAQPFRMIAHNGEINTLRGNASRLKGYEKTMSCPELSENLSEIFPVLEPGASDSASFDNTMELLVRAGRTAPHSLMMMIPEAFGPRYHISTDKRAFYEYHAAIMEPWDGPAAMVFTDGRYVGGTLDRNGLRPCRYLVTEDGRVVLASEAGVIKYPEDQITQKGRLQPGRMFLVDTEQKRIIGDNEVKGKITRQKPYRRWLEENRIELRGLFEQSGDVPLDTDTLHQRQRVFGYTREEMKVLIAPMAQNSQEPIGSMGNDVPLAVLSNRPKLVYQYFKQLFAQVTNPPIDPIREGLVMSLMSFTGKQQNLLSESPEHCRLLKLPHPILKNEDVRRLKSVRRDDFKVATLDALFDPDPESPGAALEKGLDALVDAAEEAIHAGASLLIVSDRKVSRHRVAIPALLATSALHHGLLERRLRSEAGLVIETGEAREVMHFCLLCGYGANAVNPYIVFETIRQLQETRELDPEEDAEQYFDGYINAVKKGILKTMSKMGISTLRSYHAAQQFEAIGLKKEFVDKYFRGTASRIEGVGIDQIAKETLDRHFAAYEPRVPGSLPLDFGGEYHHRTDGEFHYWNPQTIQNLQHAVVFEKPELYKKFAEEVNQQTRNRCTLRGLFDFVPGTPVPLEEVEPVEAIVRRFYTGAISHGSISKEAHETMAIAMNRLGGKANTGEGGEDPIRYEPIENPDDPEKPDSANCAIKQVASGRFGVTGHYLSHASMIQIKMAQGAKPGEGGQLPGHKVTDDIARLRHSTPGVSLISPPPHHDIYSIEDLAQLIYDLKCSNPGVHVSVKLVSEVGVGTVAAGVSKGKADEVLISGHDGGTGASPLSSIKSAGAPWEIGLAETQQTLVQNGLRDRILVQTDGQLRTGRDVVIGGLLGADRFGFGTGALIALGCIMMRKCHLGTCPVGIATQDPRLRKKFRGKADFLVRYMRYIGQEIREIMAELGFRKFDELIGRVDRLQTQEAIDHWKARGIDLSAVFQPAERVWGGDLYCSAQQDDSLDDHIDWELLEKAEPAIERREAVKIEHPIRNVNRTCGAVLSNRIVKKYGPEGLPDNTLEITLRGNAGQSFGAWLAPGVTLKLFGDTNDYLGKGLSGGRVVVVTPPEANYEPTENVIVGNTLLYGGTSGEVFINGLAGERFAVRNSGVRAVVEGVGDHGCEYMTGGVVVVLGDTGRNFAAGMSGGIAFVLDEHQLFDTRCNLDMVDLEPVTEPEDIELLHQLVERHHRWTGSERAERLLEKWDHAPGRFVKVMPIDYRRALERIREQEAVGDDASPATEEVFTP